MLKQIFNIFERYQKPLFILCIIFTATYWLTHVPQRYSPITFNIQKSEALQISRTLLKNQFDIDVSDHQYAIIFDHRGQTDRFLQKTLGHDQISDFLEQYNLSLFLWKIRFFHPLQKEEIHLAIEPKSGHLIYIQHTLPESESRPETNQDQAREIALNFLNNKTPYFKNNDYILQTEQSKKFDHRVEHIFIWEHKHMKIPWQSTEESGTAKLVASVKVSGNDILSASVNQFKAPDNFNRDIERLKSSGSGISQWLGFAFILLMSISSIYALVVRKHFLALLTVKIYLSIALILVIFHFIQLANNLQIVNYYYETAVPISSYYLSMIFATISSCTFIFLSVFTPGVAGEVLIHETQPKNTFLGLRHYLLNSFWTRTTSRQILIGYGLAIILLGVQAIIYDWGHQYLGVWKEQGWLTRMSSSFMPLFAGLFLASQAAFTEEISYRLFFIHLTRKKLCHWGSAALISSFVWGFSHTHYMVFPVWFRGIEVTLIGLIFCVFYWRNGFITVLTAHFVFDVFWSIAIYLLGDTHVLDKLSAYTLIALPAFFALIAWIKNHSETFYNTFHHRLDSIQTFNADLLSAYIKECLDKGLTLKTIRQTLIKHQWDSAVIDAAMDNTNHQE